MKNLMLRAMRTLDESICAPEYANNQLAIEMLFPEPPASMNELSVQVYSKDYRLMGADVYTPSSQKIPRKIRFTVLSDTYWDDAEYRVFVFLNGLPKWIASLTPSPFYEVWEKVRLEELWLHPKPKFFIERIGTADWWQKVYSERYDFPAPEELISKFRIYAEAKDASPHLLITGNHLMAKAFACFILSPFLTGEDTPERRIFSLGNLISDKSQWNELAKAMEQKYVIVMYVPELEYNACTVNLLSMLGDQLGKEGFNRPAFIFHGTENNVRQLLEECPSIAELFTEYSTFCLDSSNTKTLSHSELEELLPLPFDDADVKPAPTETTAMEYSAEEELRQMVGLKQLKKEILEARMMSLFLKERRELHLERQTESRYHMLFLGNPGTGKTTVAKLVGKMYHQIGLLSKGHTVETCRTNLVGEYLGQTEKRMREVIDEARGGVLFIDEAYTLMENDNDSKDYGREVINALLTILSEPNPDMIVILAGYEDKMKKLLKSNPGLRDRFPLRFHFEDYTSDELSEIAHRILKSRNFVLTPEADERLNRLIETETRQRDEYFGNGRWVHNLIEQGLIKSMAQRVMTVPRPQAMLYQLFSTIEVCDVEAVETSFLHTMNLSLTPPCRIGFRA